MSTFPTERLRNVVLLSHSGAGKTLLAESMLHAAGVTNRLGAIEDGTTVSDYEPEEQRRTTSIQTSLLQYPWKEHKINILDTPGYADYRSEVVSGVRVADSAVIVIAGPSGVEVGTHQMWQMADERNLPRIIFINKLDRENVDFQRVMDSLEESFGRKCVPVHVPIGSEAEFSGCGEPVGPGGRRAGGDARAGRGRPGEADRGRGRNRRRPRHQIPGGRDAVGRRGPAWPGAGVWSPARSSRSWEGRPQPASAQPS